MLLTACLVAAMIAGQTPDQVYKAAALDLAENVPPEKRRVTRYLSLVAVPPEERPKFLQSLAFALNSVSFRSQMFRPVVIGDLLVRIDLGALGWDRESRIARRARLALSGVKDKSSADPWEAFVQLDPYFKVTQVDAKGYASRGWLDPVIEESARKISQSSSFILRADWLLPRLLVEKGQGGFYSDVLMFPDQESDLYRYFGIDIALIDRENQLRQGGAVLESVVAIHNRELQQIPSLYGWDEKVIWRTFDVANDADADKNVLESFGGSLKHDGREIIMTLPNGLHAYYLADAAGKQVSVVPQNLALDMRTGRNLRDRNVLNAISCLSCHGPASGVYPFDDIVGKAILEPSIALAVISKDKKKVADKTAALEDYYQSDLGRKVSRQQSSYADRVLACNGVEPGENTKQLTGFFDKYFWDLVSTDQAVREMGLPKDQAIAALRASGNSQLIVLSSGQPIRRAGWERSFAQAMRAVVWTWESSNINVKAHRYE